MMADHAASPDTDSPLAPCDAMVRHWLLAVAALVFCMIIVGGATRLTGSGLSITEWQPIIGVIPPWSEADWQAAFAKYQQIPQYERVNRGMSLDAFKTIYLWEWGHRFLGRGIGAAFALPLLWFWARGRLPRGSAGPLLGILALGGLQGVAGWYMVSSGLSERVDVSQYRLALHLTIAFLILAALVWVWVPLALPRPGTSGQDLSPTQRAMAWVIVVLLTAQIVAGAFVAGLKAGLAHNTWPLMDGDLIPSGLLVMQPWWLNVFENALTVQFNHRMLAYVILLLVGWHAVQLRRSGVAAAVRQSAMSLLAAGIFQALIGIWTLLAHVPLGLGLAHQGGGAIVYAIAVWHAHAVTYASRGDSG